LLAYTTQMQKHENSLSLSLSLSHHQKWKSPCEISIFL
jgi:hypothetical protein